MAEIDWSGQTATTPWLQRVSRLFLDWEDWLTLLLTLGAALSVSAALEAGGWSERMPPITLVSFLAVLAALVITQSRLSPWLAWPLAVLLGVLVVFWQTLDMVGPGNLGQRLDQIYLRFEDWLHLATSGGVSNDSLPFDVLVLGLTWLGVFLFGWSVHRWHNAWVGLIPGGVALFVDLVFVGDELSGIVLLYLLFGFLLVMRTNLMAKMVRWRTEGTPYPALISLTFLNFSAWALIGLLTAAWVAPVGPFSTPPLVEAASRGLEEIGLNFVRLAGPLEVKKVVPVHNYTGVLPFQGSVKLGDREVLSVEIGDVSVTGPVPLRGAVYDIYTSGGWKAGERREFDLPALQERLDAQLKDGSVNGVVIPMNITVERKSVVGTVLFSPGEPVKASVPFKIEVPAAAISDAPPLISHGGIDMSDQDVLAALPAQLVGLSVERDADGLVLSVQVIRDSASSLPEALVARPPERLAEGTSYKISGFVPTVTPEELRATEFAYPEWITKQYLGLPDTLPERVRQLASEVSGYSTTPPVRPIIRFSQARLSPDDVRGYEVTSRELPSPYDLVKAIEEYLRAYPLDYRVSEAPPGADAVDYFLFESRRGYFDYHASAMVVMLRALGIPARLAVGYVIDDADFDAERGAYSVRDRNSYSWAEVYFPKHGWIAFNPSPDRDAELTPTVVDNTTPPGSTDPITDGPPDLPLNDDPTNPIPPAPGDNLGQLPVRATDKYNPLLTAGVFAFVALLAGAVALGWQRSVAGLPYPQQLWEKTVRLATWAGHPPQPGQTPSEFGRHLERVFHGATEFRLLASIYNRSRFGKQDVAGEEREHLRTVWPDLRGDLLAAIPRRFVKRKRRV